MPKVIETTVYAFDELSDKAREKARAWWREGAFDGEWYDATLEDAYAIARLMGLDIRPQERYDARRGIQFRGFSSQGDGASFAGSFKGTEGKALEQVKAYAPKDEVLHRIADQLDSVWRLTGEGLICQIGIRGHYCHEYSMAFEFEHEWGPEHGPTPEQISSAEEQVVKTCRSFARWIYHQLESEYEYQNSDEHVDENIRANEYTFTAEGKRYG